ncbi:MAG: response regulator [Kiritimatiellae bacterium]|nr:response regulator [Kiritimatiellia bacterium]
MNDASSGKECKGNFYGGLRSIRTRYSLMTATFLLLILAVFYVGGRVVLVHLVREAEQQVKDVGLDIARLAYRNAGRMREATAPRVGAFAASLAAGRPAEEVLASGDARDLSFIAGYSMKGELRSAAQRRGGAVERLDAEALRHYAVRIAGWIEHGMDKDRDRSPLGIMRIGGVTHYVTLVRRPDDAINLVIGAPFDMMRFAAQVGESHAAYDVRVKGPNAPVAATARRPPAAEENPFGLAPMLSEALNFYSGGFWKVYSEPFEAVFAVRDISGRAISTIAVSMPQAFARVTGSALGRLTFFVAMAGILLIVPIFWLHGRLFLDPLTRMTGELRYLAERHEDADCPRIEWDGRDEFALLAESVNRLLETISAHTVSLGQLKIRQRALINGVPDALAVFDDRGRLVSVTKQPEEVFPLPGLRAGEPPDGAVYGLGGIAAFAEALSRVFAGAKVEQVRLEDFSAPEASRRHFELRLTKMDEHFALAIIRDDTREFAEHELRLAAERRVLDSLKRESLTLFAAGIAHDVNNVLAVILSTVEATAAAAGNGDDPRLDAVRDAVKRGSAMTRELMAFAGESKMSLVRLKPSFVVHDVQMLVEGVVGPNIDISFDLAPDAPDIDADPNQFWKVIFNIVKNAAEAIGSNPGHIQISTERCEMTAELGATFRSEHPLQPGPGVVISITDDGPGIRVDVLPRLFDPYVSSKSIGRGLGLATVRTIVEAHGGGIRVDSEMNGGATFRIFLPASSQPEPAAPPPAAAAGTLPREVLVVDNDEAILKMCSFLLKTLKVTPHVARDRHESLALLRRLGDRIGAIVLDVNLGGIDTVRLLHSFRLAAPSVRVVVSSGSREEEIRELFAAHPFDAFLAKPYTLAELKASLTG